MSECQPRYHASDEKCSFATVAAVIASIKEDTEVPVPRRTTRSQSARLNLGIIKGVFLPFFGKGGDVSLKKLFGSFLPNFGYSLHHLSNWIWF